MKRIKILFVLLSLCVLWVAAGSLPLAPIGRVVDAAAPPAGTVGPNNVSTGWQGVGLVSQPDVLVGDGTSCPPSVDPANVLCDHYYLTVDVPASYWETHTGGVEISISWQSADDDFDLYVFDTAGNLVKSSAAGGTTSERVFIPSAYGTYEVRVFPFLVIPATTYTGSANFASQNFKQPNPPRSTGGITFAPAVVIDAQRTEGEPINYIDKDGNYWESGPWGTSTQQSFIHRSTDGGNQFNIVSPVGLRPDAPPGGGDTDIVTDDQGNAYFVDLEGLVNLGVAVSNDNGNSWRKNPLGVQSALDDRQWFAADNGLTSAASDNTIFLGFRQQLGVFVYSSPGSTGLADPVGGLAYQNAATVPTPLTTASRCGQMRFDPVKRNLYYPCSIFSGDQAEILIGHVNPGQRTGIQFRTVRTPHSPAGGTVWNLFPILAIDSLGNVYVVWVDGNDNNVYYSYSANEGMTWSTPMQVNGGDANSNVMPWAVAGTAGNLAVAWYGSPSVVDSDLMPSWYNNRMAASEFKWYGYVSLVQNAASATPTFYQTRFTEKPMNYGQICTGGLGCTISNGDRTMADYFAITLDKEGAVRAVYNDTTSQHHGAHLFEARQLTGPTALGTTLAKPAPANPMADPTGDAQSPHYAPEGAGANLPQLDLTQVKLSQPNPKTLRVQMSVASLASFAPPPGKSAAFWLTRFQALSTGDGGEESYRIFYVGAQSQNGAAPTYFAGSGLSAQGAIRGNGCVTTTPENCKVVEYPMEQPASGSVSGNTITIDVNLENGFGPGRPLLSTTLFSVTALTGGRNDDTNDIYADVDASRAFDFTLGTTTPPPPPAGRRANGGGAIQGTNGSDGVFELNVSDDLKGKVQYRDTGANVNFRSSRILATSYDAAKNALTIKGTGVDGSLLVNFTAVVADNGEPGRADTFQLSLSNGYERGGTLLRGNIQVR